jgi:hypothetical protein
MIHRPCPTQITFINTEWTTKKHQTRCRHRTVKRMLYMLLAEKKKRQLPYGLRSEMCYACGLIFFCLQFPTLSYDQIDLHRALSGRSINIINYKVILGDNPVQIHGTIFQLFINVYLSQPFNWPTFKSPQCLNLLNVWIYSMIESERFWESLISIYAPMQ